MLPLTGAYTATFPKSFIQAARSNVILVTVLLISAIFLTSCGISGASAYAPSNAKGTNARRSEFGSTREAGSSSFKAAESSSSVQTESSGHITVAATFPHATVGSTYNTVVSVSGGKAPYQFSILWGALPPGLTINPTTGTISGTPFTSGTYQFAVQATDFPNNDRGDHRMTMVVEPPSVGIIVQVSPTSATVLSGGTQQFTATVTGTSNVAVTWSATVGSVSKAGLFTAPVVTALTAVTVSATSVADPSKKASADVTVTPTVGNGPVITTTSLPAATAGVAYGTTLAASGGKLPYRWTLSGGTLPQGLNLDPTSGDITGTTNQSGTFAFTAQVTDSASLSDTQPLSLSVFTQNNSGFDGPAELPRVYLKTTLADTPTPGKTISVNAGGDFQGALNGASCGDTIQLQAGAIFTGPFTLPAKSCDDQHWITIRTGASDSSLPAEGTRVTPCYAGVASLPGRPSFSCSKTQNVLSQLVYTQTSGSGPIFFATGANHYRLLGLEITRSAGTGYIGSLASVSSGQVDHIVFDRVWMHGTATDETGRGLYLNAMTNAAVVDSFFTDFHCTSAVGACTDAQAISGGSGTSQDGPFKIVDNFLEASSECILFGGGPATTTPTDIEIRRNHLFKPMTWKQGQPGYVGGQGGSPFVVKNHFELKNAQRVLFEGNILENTWGGFSQSGYSILLTPKNQNWNGTNVCPICQVTDVTIRYSTISHVGSGVTIATDLSGAGGMALAGERYSIHDVTLDDISATNYQGNGTLFLVLNTWKNGNVLNSITINHITGFTDPGTHLLSLENLTTNPTMSGFNFTNNIVEAGRYPVWSAGGGSTNCGYSDVPVTSIPLCFNQYSFSDNAIVATPAAFPPSKWPSSNYFPVDANAVQFVNYKNANGGDYHLSPSSPYKNAGSDGKDLGADIDVILAATSGVY